MKNEIKVSRRNFLIKTSLGLGAGIAGTSLSAFKPVNSEEEKISSQKICVSSIDLKGLRPDSTRESRIKRVLNRMGEVAGLKPDIICLPELFDTIWVDEKKPVKEVAEDEKVPGPVTSRIAEFAKNNNCYIVCPVYTKNNGRYFNSSLLIDRKGNIAGVYHKMHPTKTEILVN